MLCILLKFCYYETDYVIPFWNSPKTPNLFLKSWFWTETHRTKFLTEGIYMEKDLLPVKPFHETLFKGMCGPASLKMVFAYYGIEKSEEEIAKLAGTTDDSGTDS